MDLREAFVFATGGSPINAYRFMRKPDVQLAIRKRRETLTDHLIISREKLLDELEEAKQMSFERGSSMDIKNIKDIVELQAKMLGYFEPIKVDVGIKALYLDFGIDDILNEDSDIVDIEEVEDDD